MRGSGEQREGRRRDRRKRKGQGNAGYDEATGQSLSSATKEKVLTRHRSLRDIHIDGQQLFLQQELCQSEVPYGRAQRKSPHGATEAFGPCKRRSGWWFAQGILRFLCQFSACVRNACGCHEYGRYKYSRPGNMDATIVFESWITIQD